NDTTMKKASPEGRQTAGDDLRPEYRFDYTRSRPNRFTEEPVTVQLEPDVAAAFPTSDAVNPALRKLLRAPRTTRRSTHRKRRANKEVRLASTRRPTPTRTRK